MTNQLLTVSGSAYQGHRAAPHPAITKIKDISIHLINEEQYIVRIIYEKMVYKNNRLSVTFRFLKVEYKKKQCSKS